LREKNYDIVVVGAGPAGSMAARAAAKAGAKVLLLDKRRELGVPVQCGEALAEEPLRDLGIKPDPRWIAGEVNAVRLISPSGIEVSIAEKSVVHGKVGFVLDRKIFDKHLAMLAAKEGADVRVGTLVDGLLMDGKKIAGVKASSFDGRMEVRAEVVIAADGVVSKVARWAGVNTALKPNDIESCAQFQMVGIDVKSPEVMEFYFGSKITPGGYAWIFPKGEEMANVGIGVLGSRMQCPAIEYLKNFVDSRPELKKGRVIEINGGGVPVGGPIPKTVKENLLIVGDAARQVNALTGGGIDSAMRAGDIAGEVAAKAVASGEVSEKKLMEYEKRWRELMGKRLERYLKAKDVLLSMSDDELDRLAKALQGVEFDKISLTDMLKVLTKVNPKLLWKLKGLM
jgi:digeranylgeranylglycerophospholipid reductase